MLPLQMLYFEDLSVGMAENYISHVSAGDRTSAKRPRKTD